MKNIFEKQEAEVDILRFLHMGFKAQLGIPYYVSSGSYFQWVNGLCELRLEAKTGIDTFWRILNYRKDNRFEYNKEFIDQAIKPFILNKAISEYKGKKNINSVKERFFNDRLCNDSHARNDEDFYWLEDTLYMDVYNVAYNVAHQQEAYYVGRFKLYNLLNLYPLSIGLSYTGFIHGSQLTKSRTQMKQSIIIQKHKGRLL